MANEQLGVDGTPSLADYQEAIARYPWAPSALPVGR